MTAPVIVHHQHLIPVQIGAPILPVGAMPSPHTLVSPIYSQNTIPSPTATLCPPLYRPHPNQSTLSCYNSMLINYSMELVWHGEFNRLFQNFLPNKWVLNPTFSLPKGRKWTMFKDSAKVRFLCQECSHGWTSMKGRVVFWFTFDEQRNLGLVLFRLFGQRCQNCSPKSFEHAMWYPEEVVKVVGNIFNRIGQEFYGFYSPPVRIDRRAGKPRSQHNATLCQACAEGICPGEFDASVETFGLYRKSSRRMSSSTGRSHSGSVSSQYSPDISSLNSIASTSDDGASSDIISEIGFDEAGLDTASEADIIEDVAEQTTPKLDTVITENDDSSK